MSPQQAKPNQKLLIVARTDTGMLQAAYPAGRDEMSAEVAREISFLNEDVAAFVARSLPPAESDLWGKGQVNGAKSANLVLLVSVRDLQSESRLGTRGDPQRIFAKVGLRLIRPDGEVLWDRAFEGVARNVPQPKRMTSSAKPEAQAAYAALGKGCRAVSAFIKELSAVQIRSHPVPVIEPKPVDINLTIDSTPRGASIYIDGWFRGTTPSVVPLPERELTLKIHLQGYHPVEEVLVPQQGMNLAPRLMPLPGTIPPQEAPTGDLPPLGEDAGKADTTGKAIGTPPVSGDAAVVEEATSLPDAE